MRGINIQGAGQQICSHFFFLQMSRGKCSKCGLQAEADGAGQIPVRSQEAAPQADDSSFDPRAQQTGQPAGPPPGCLHRRQSAAYSLQLLQVMAAARGLIDISF